MHQVFAAEFEARQVYAPSDFGWISILSAATIAASGCLVTPGRFLACVKVLTLIRKVFSYNSRIRGIFETTGVMGRVEEMASERATILLNQAIEAFLLESSIEQRLGQVSACIEKLEDYKPEVLAELNELKQIRSILASAQQHLAPQRDLEITDRLLELYVTVSDGALIF